jgi:hypothetical protein
MDSKALAREMFADALEASLLKNSSQNIASLKKIF